MGASDGGTRLAAAIAALIARWQAEPPPTPIIAAGIVSGTPALARLLVAVLALPQGQVVLPGLDLESSEAGDARFEAIACAEAAPPPAKGDPLSPRDSEAHPQHAFKLLLARLRLSRADVLDWGFGGGADGPAARTSLVMAAMAPAEAGEGWADADTAANALPDHGQAFANVRVVEAATAAEEAQVVALALRRSLQTPGATAALVTPDRALARRVAAHCRRWGIAVDDSAGTPLPRTPPGALVLAMVAAMAGQFDPVRLLALLKHPLVSPAAPAEPLEARLAWLRRVRQLDLALRGVRPAPGLEGIGAQIDYWLQSRRDETRDLTLAAWWDDVAALLAPLETLASRRETRLDMLAETLRQMGEALAGERIWAGTDGRALAARIEALIADGALFGTIEIAEAPALVDALLADVAVRPGWGGHPRLAILGPVEAQLARADLMILAGLNEAVWPAQPSPDPWLAPAIRAALGLPGAARAMGLAAQDFVRALGAPQVLITRSRRDAGGPMRASRLLLRLDALAARLGVGPEGLVRDDLLLRLARGLDTGLPPVRIDRPAPAPPAMDRPRVLSVTEVDTLIADPFALYAAKMLRLRPLDPLDDDPGAAYRGEAIHEVLERWVKGGHPDLASLSRLTEAMLQTEGRDFPLLRALWGPRARAAIEWAGSALLEGVAAGRIPVGAETRGALTLDNGVQINGKADRIDRIDGQAEGGFAIIDYKTGSVPKIGNVRLGYANQLPLLALMIERGGMHLPARTPEEPPKNAPNEALDEAINRASVTAIEYWQLGGNLSQPGKISLALGKEQSVLLPQHLVTVFETVTDFTSRLLCGVAAFRSQVHPALVWGDYNHLARVLEWRDRPRADTPTIANL
jgi:ATP-dependent helicase/nuclease subunit B